MTETVTKKYKLVFLPISDYQAINAAIPAVEKQNYGALTAQGYENFSVGNSEVVFIPEKYRNLLSHKARKGEAL